MQIFGCPCRIEKYIFAKMPHAVDRVTSFFRSHSNSFDFPVEVKKGSRRGSNSRPALSDRASSSGSSITSDDRSLKMPENHKRLSLGHLTSPKSSSTKIPQHNAATLDVVMESPPLVFFGTTSNSSGALLSGQLVLNIHEDSLAIDTFKMRLALEVTRKKPFHAHCPDCTNQSTDITSWSLLEGPATLRRGEHSFPFSCVIPGHLPASTKGSLSSVEYVLRATLNPRSGEPLKLSHKLDVKRAINPADSPRHSIRIFPPTNLTANCQLPSVIHPIGETMISMRVDGVVKRNVDTKTQTQWKLKRVNWRLDETQKMISPACSKHALKATDEQKKGVAHQDTRTIGTDEMKAGWKSDYNSPDGSIDLEFPISIRPDAKPICDLKAEDGTEVMHILIVEMIVAEEFAPIKKPTQVTPTGAARVLRMHFNLTVTERAGLGISWDEEAPPTYENVPASPPGYGNSEEYSGPPIPDYEDLTPLDSVVEELPHEGNSEGPSVRRGSNNNRSITIEDLADTP